MPYLRQRRTVNPSASPRRSHGAFRAGGLQLRRAVKLAPAGWLADEQGQPQCSSGRTLQSFWNAVARCWGVASASVWRYDGVAAGSSRRTACGEAETGRGAFLWRRVSLSIPRTRLAVPTPIPKRSATAPRKAPSVRWTASVPKTVPDAGRFGAIPCERAAQGSGGLTAASGTGRRHSGEPELEPIGTTLGFRVSVSC